MSRGPETGLTLQRLLHSSGEGTISGTLAVPDGADARLMLVCIHGGGCNGSYFTLGAPSVVEAALARGFRVLLVDRPGHGGSPAGAASEQPILDSLRGIGTFIERVREEHAPGSGLVMIGHSIGGAIALMLAAERREWPLRGVAVSGIARAFDPRLVGESRRRDAPARRVRRVALPGAREDLWLAGADHFAAGQRAVDQGRIGGDRSHLAQKLAERRHYDRRARAAAARRA
jgi:pimeloyl-ACP methyl ester carboxylesterase